MPIPPDRQTWKCGQPTTAAIPWHIAGDSRSAGSLRLSPLSGIALPWYCNRSFYWDDERCKITALLEKYIFLTGKKKHANLQVSYRGTYLPVEPDGQLSATATTHYSIISISFSPDTNRTQITRITQIKVCTTISYY